MIFVSAPGPPKHVKILQVLQGGVGSDRVS